jgi:hypothetical protein
MALQWFGFAVGILIVLGTFISVTGTLIVPRATTPRVARTTGLMLGELLRTVARLRKGYEWRDRVLAWQGPLGLLLTLVTWIGLLFFGFALMLWPSSASFGLALAVSGSSLVTLGIVTAHPGGPTAITFIESGAGLIVVALEIAYLPAMYGAFNRREGLVTLLDSAAGQPSWGPEILARAELNDNIDVLGSFYARWEEWAADVAESHSTYPILIFLRSPQPMRSWVTGLLSVMDAAALQLSITPLSVPPSARRFLRMGKVAFDSIASTVRVPTPQIDGAGLERAEFDEAVELLEEAGWNLETSQDEAWETFSKWRGRYVVAAYSLADATFAPRALWSGSRTRLRNDEPPVPPKRDPVMVEELQRLKQDRRDLRHRVQHEHIAHHGWVHEVGHDEAAERA